MAFEHSSHGGEHSLAASTPTQKVTLVTIGNSNEQGR
jgi:hypothetical protein